MEYHYVKLANDLERNIRSGRYKAGEKLPSIRAMRSQTGRSISTVSHAYEELEKRGIVDVREKSGFYVRPMIEKIKVNPLIEQLEIRPLKVAKNAMATLLQQSHSNPDILTFGTALPGPDLLPGKELAREMRGAAARWANGEMIGYCEPVGYRPLRDEIEKRMVGCFNSGQGDEVIITSGCLAAIDLSLRAVAKEGDIILIESPTFLCYLQLIEDLNMRPLEVPADPDRGLDLPLLEKVLGQHQVQAALLNTNFHNPLGYAMPDGEKKEMVELFHNREIPIIEDDIYGDLYFGETRPRPLKTFDRKGLVMYCSSFTKTMAPDLRIGWTVPGRFREKIERLKFNSSVANQQLVQFVISQFLGSGGHDRHLRRMRGSLRKQLGSFMKAIVEYFPERTRISEPKGGLCLWVEFDEGIDTMEVFKRASEYNIGVVPGAFCSATSNYNNCLRLNFGYPWTEQSEEGVRTLGQIIRELEADLS